MQYTNLLEKALNLYKKGYWPLALVFKAVDKKGNVYYVKETLTIFGRKPSNEEELKEAFYRALNMIGKKERFIVNIRRLNHPIYFKEADVKELTVLEPVDVTVLPYW